MVFALSKNARLRFLNTVIKQRQDALRIELTKWEKGFQQKKTMKIIILLMTIMMIIIVMITINDK